MKLIALVILFLCSYEAFSQPIEIVCEIDLSTLNLSEFKAESTNLISKDNVSLGTFWTVDLQEIIRYHNKLELNSGFVMVEDYSGQTSGYSLSCFDPQVAMISPMLIINRSNVSLGDTLVFRDKGNNQLSDFSKDLNNHQKNIVRKKVRLQIQQSELKDLTILSANSLVFPIDKSIKRWQRNIKKISIYRIKKG